METITAILAYLTQQNFDTKLKFYNRLGFNLTIAIRSICSTSSTSYKQKIEGIKAVNELSHCIFNWVERLKKGDKTFDDSSCFSDIKLYAKQNKVAAGEIGEAVLSSYLSVKS